MFRRFAAAAAILALSAATPALAGETVWQPWTPDVFARAKAENRFVLLDLAAVWCHWCHVMEATTYKDDAVTKLLGARYITVRVDQDANPDLSNRYGDWGWPATIVFAPDGSEIVKRQGYMAPPQMASLLQAIIDDPSPGPSVVKTPEVVPAKSAYLTDEQRKALKATLADDYDAEHGGWGDGQHYLFTTNTDYLLAQSIAGDRAAEKQARQTLDAALGLFDKEWGGVFQYSEGGAWTTPHYEKVMQYQATYLRHYSTAYAHFRQPEYLAAAKSIGHYLSAYLKSPEGAFYGTQDADLSEKVEGHEYYALASAERLKLGLPRIDKGLYARENGWAASGLAALYNVTGDKDTLAEAEAAFRWVLTNRTLPGGGFSHGEHDRAGPFLGDTLAMGQAALDLYFATGKREDLDIAVEAANYIGANFEQKSGGFATTMKNAASEGAFAKPVVQVDEMISLARFLNLTARTSGKPGPHALAERAMRYLASAEVLDLPGAAAGVLLADNEFTLEPMHITIVGHKDDLAAADLHKAARLLPSIYKRLDWWDMREGPAQNPDVTYPELPTAAAFACSTRLCSEPVTDAAQLPVTVSRMLALRKDERAAK